MISIDTVGLVSAEGELVVKLPTKLPPGEHHVVVVVDTVVVDTVVVDTKVNTEREQEQPPLPLIFSAYPAAPVSQTTFRREDMYDDDGR